MIKINFLFISLLGIGKISKIPGTIASLFTTILLFIFIYFFNISPYIILIFIFIIFFLSLYSINIYTKKLDNKDPKIIVVDELIGQSIPICLYEIFHGSSNEIKSSIIYYFIIFVLFRIFDITKPYPVSYFDKKIKNSFGVVMDDVCAGIYVVVVLILYMNIFP